MMRALGVALVTAWFLAGMSGAAAMADSGLAGLHERLIRSDVLRADFRQEKKLRVLSRPLISNGKLVFAAGEGVLWQVLEPHEVFILMKPGELVEWDRQSGTRRVDTKSNPAFSAMTDVILATLTGDTQVLRRHFDLSVAPLESGWRLTLRPKSNDLGAIISEIQVSGDQFIEGVRVTEAKGDTTEIQFSGFRVEPAELDEIEKDYFSQ